jgi:hypothetical protein
MNRPPFEYANLKMSMTKAPELEHNKYEGEVNPGITYLYLKSLNSGDTVWEPFAGVNVVKTFALCERFDINLVAYDIAATDSRAWQLNSLKICPEDFQGVVFHPSYFGSDPFSASQEELALNSSLDKYKEELEKCVKLASRANSVCIVGRTYKHQKETIYLDWIYVELFMKYGFKIKKMISSMPDVGVILERG